MWRRHTLSALAAGIVALGISPLLAFGSADFDNSLQVDFNDLLMWTNYWLYDYNDNQRCEMWDLDDSNVIDFNDLAEIAEDWLADYDFGDFADFAPYWRREVDYRFLDDRFDLSGDGFVDFGDFSVLAGEWMTTMNPCDDTNVSGPWGYKDFTGIGTCGLYDCWFEEDYSDPYNDNCGHSAYMGCVETPEYDFYCAYNYWFAGRRVGLCVYTCGRNSFQIRKNASGRRILQTRHLTRDIPPQDPECSPWGCDGCDEGTIDKYDWQITHYNDVTGVRTIYCRESYLEPVTNDLWEPYQGEPSSCELSW